MMKKSIRYVIYSLFIMQLTGCKVDFNPNAEWKDIPVVYCLLDQDDDTTWVRVQKCYLGEDNLNAYMQISDSINYPEGAIQVKMLQKSNGVVSREFDFEYTLRHDKLPGQFASVEQPLYACRTKGQLVDDADYELLVIKGSDTIARSTTNLIYGDYHLYEPNPAFSHEFKFRTGICNVEWASLNNARLYQPVVRFFYKSWGDTLFVDIPCVSKLVQRNQERFSIQIQQNTYMNDLKTALQSDTSRKKFVDFVEIFINACTEDLNAYMASQYSGTSVTQNQQIYSNIQGGLGIFSARRLHLSTMVPCDSTTGTASNMSYRDLIRSLDVGFE